MRKYKYGDLPTSRRWLTRSNLLYFALAWNAFGFCVYQWWKKKKTQGDSEWSQMTSTQKYVSLMSKPDDEIKVIKISGLSVEEKKDTIISTYIKPSDVPPPPSSATLNSS